MNTKFKLSHLNKTSFVFIFKFSVHMSVHNPAQNIHFKLQDIKKEKQQVSPNQMSIRVNVQWIISFMYSCKYD